MDDLTNIVCAAYNPYSEFHQEAQEQLIELKNNDPNALIAKICESIQNQNQTEGEIINLLIISRELFRSNDQTDSEDQDSIQITSENISIYFNILILKMKDESEKIRYHSSITFAIFGYYFILRDSDFLSNIFEVLKEEEITFEFLVSFETSLLYIVNETTLSTEQNEMISKFIFSRLINDDENSSIIKEKQICLEMICKISLKFFDFFDENEINSIFNYLKEYSNVFELSYYSFSIWSIILDKKPESINDEFFNELIKNSIQIVSNIENEIDSSNLDKKELYLYESIRSVIFKFWFLNLYSKEKSSLILPFFPQISQFGLKNLTIPSLDVDCDNRNTDFASALLASMVVNFPNESFELFKEFIQSNIECDHSNLTSPLDYQNLYASFVLILLFLKSELALNFLDISINAIQIAFDLSLEQLYIVALNIINQLTKFYDAETIETQVDFTSLLPICFSFLESEKEILRNESDTTIKKLIKKINFISQVMPNKNSNYDNFNIMDCVIEVIRIIDSTTSPPIITSCFNVLDDMIVYIKDFDALYEILKYSFKMMSDMFEVNPNNIIISACCNTITSILKNDQKFTFDYEFLYELFQFLKDLLESENGEVAIFSIGFISFSLKDKFEPMLSDSISTAIELIQNDVYIENSLACLQTILLSCNSSDELPSIIDIIGSVLSDEKASSKEFIISFGVIKTIIKMYIKFLNQESNTESLFKILNFLNTVITDINDMVNKNRNAAIIIINNVFESYSFLLMYDIQKFHSMILSRFFIAAKALIVIQKVSNEYDDDDDDFDDVVDYQFQKSFILNLIVVVNFLADNFEHNILDILQCSGIYEYLTSIAESLNEEEEEEEAENKRNSKVLQTIYEIFQKVNHEKQ